MQALYDRIKDKTHSFLPDVGKDICKLHIITNVLEC
jgi:hypothetical protein